MKKVLAAIVVFAGFGFVAGAQIDPTVEVSRNYQSTLKLTPKPVPQMAVPDSLLRFDLDFDYSVFDRAFKGTGDFKPYLLDLQPRPDAYRGKKLYLKAGLGYTLHPELDFVYTPETGKNTEINIYATHRSYFGKYKYRVSDFKVSDYSVQTYNSGATVATDITPEDVAATHVKDRDWTGYDAYTKVGVNGAVAFSSSSLFFNANYKGIHGKDGMKNARTGADNLVTSFNVLESLLGLSGTINDDFAYNVALSFNIGGESSKALEKKINLVHYGVDGSLVKNLTDSKIGLGFHFETSSYTGGAKVGNWHIAPRYLTDVDGFRLNIGLKIGSIIKSDYTWYGMPYSPHKSQIVYPDVHVACQIIEDEMEFYASATGGDNFFSLEQIKEVDHLSLPKITDNGVEHFNLKAGLRGNAFRVLRYDVSAGYRKVSSSVFYELERAQNIVYSGDSELFDSYTVLPYNIRKTCFHDLSEAYLNANLIYDSNPVYIEGNLNLKAPSVKIGKRSNEEYFANIIFKPRKVTAEIKAMYAWKSRIRGGISARFASKSEFDGESMTPGMLRYSFNTGAATMEKIQIKSKGYINGYVDLGINGEYTVDRMVTVYGRISNLLNQKYYSNTLVPVSGLYATLGIIVNM